MKADFASPDGLANNTVLYNLAYQSDVERGKHLFSVGGEVEKQMGEFGIDASPAPTDTVTPQQGFGNFLDLKRAVTIGMLCDVPAEKIRFVGNTAISGAKTVLLSRKALAATEQIASSMTYFDLMSHPGYMDEFIKAGFLPHTSLELFPTAEPVGNIKK